jgi:beta-lysine 5,6-aminomutase alpha subunit
MGKLNLPTELIDQARAAARLIAEQMDEFIAVRSTVATERAVLRLMGMDGAHDGVPHVNLVVDHLHEKGLLDQGAFMPVMRAMEHTGLTVGEVAESVARGELPLDRFSQESAASQTAGYSQESTVSQTSAISGAKEADRETAGAHHNERPGEAEAVRHFVEQRLAVLDGKRRERDHYVERFGKGQEPLLYVIVATGDIYEDIVQACSSARQGADIIAVIRSTGQSLLDYVPHGETREGYGGTFATQENFRLMRQALDEVGEEEGRYIRLCNYCSGLCMPEIAAAGALERLDVMLNDALYGILFRDINMKRTLVDQYFSRMINSYAGIVINTGEDNYLTTADAVESAYTVLASQFMNEQFAAKSGLPPEQMGLGHAFEMNPDLEDGFLFELAQAQMARQIFPEAPLKYMPPTKHMTGNIFKGHVQDAMFNMVSIMTGQGIQLLGMMTEAMHTPHIHDRYLALENAKYIFNNARHLGDELYFKPGGKVEQRALHVLAEAARFLQDVERMGLFEALATGMFADVKRTIAGGRGLNGVFLKGGHYVNPFEDALRKRLGLPERKGVHHASV